MRGEQAKFTQILHDGAYLIALDSDGRVWKRVDCPECGTVWQEEPRRHHGKGCPQAPKPIEITDSALRPREP